MHKRTRAAILIAASSLVLCAARFKALEAPEQAAIDRISADSMRGNLSFLSSDLLEGRNTPSRGLDIAADFIASRFRAAGLEPIGPNQTYFQDATFAEVTPNFDSLSITLAQSGSELRLDRADASVLSLGAIDVSNAPVLKLPANGLIPDVAGKIVAGDARRWGEEALLAELQSRKPAMILLLSRRELPAESGPSLIPLDIPEAPVLRIYNRDAAESLTRTDVLTVKAHLAAPVRHDAILHNVAGILRGSDPTLASQVIAVTAHYDHLGERTSGADRIYNGANDNASGVVSVIELANALSALTPHPRRSILFMTFFGEEEGLFGSYYYVRHPLFPLADTVADINLEQLGRTDDTFGKQVNSFAWTGPDYSDLPGLFSAAAQAEGVHTWINKSADEFFDRSDNYAFALHGVIAHTAVVAFEYPDYHAVGDDWRKIDYANMAKVDRGLAAGILALADSPDRPKWSDSHQAARYRESKP